MHSHSACKRRSLLIEEPLSTITAYSRKNAGAAECHVRVGPGGPATKPGGDWSKTKGQCCGQSPMRPKGSEGQVALKLCLATLLPSQQVFVMMHTRFPKFISRYVAPYRRCKACCFSDPLSNIESCLQ